MWKGVPTSACAYSVLESFEPMLGDTAIYHIPSSSFSSTFVGCVGTYVRMQFVSERMGG